VGRPAPSRARPTQRRVDPARWEVLAHADQVVAAVHPRQAPDHDYLGLIAVDPDHQRQSFGTTIVRALQNRAEARGVPLWLSVYRTNPARHLYVHLGFGWRERDPLRIWMAWPRDTTMAPPAGPKDVPDGFVTPPPLDLPETARLG